MKQQFFNIIISVIAATWRYKTEGPMPESPCVIAFWHGKMLPGWHFFRKKNPSALVSLSKDGSVLASLLKHWGFSLIRGSSSRKQGDILADMVETCKDSMLLVTPDGPRGPANKMKPGALLAAQRAGVPLFLCGIKIGQKKIFNKSWDNFEFPCPFSKIYLKFEVTDKLDDTLSRDEISRVLEIVEKRLTFINEF
ncbi:MAG: lysophospholipid acyltransferase family protein [Candidatus Kapaibacterium sp.]